MTVAIVRAVDYPLSEASVQDLVYRWCLKARHEITVPNCGMAWGFDSDVASVAKTLMGHEFEIKISRADWLSELRQINGESRTDKYRRAKRLRSAEAIASAIADRGARRRYVVVDGERCSQPPPNHFWMVAPPGVVKPDELPAYAGMMEVAGDRLHVIKAAPKLHPMKMTDRQLMAMARGATLRYWRSRVGTVRPGRSG